jgi:glucose-6-phosphate 1-dehydrogenase
MSDLAAPIGPFDYVVIGGNGDLALRKLLPALYLRDRDGQLPEAGRIIGVSRAPLTQQNYSALVGDALHKHVNKEDLDAASLERFQRRLHFVTADASSSEGWERLAALLREVKGRIRVFYLAVSPHLFGPICQRLQEAGSVDGEARVVLEKPIGHDLASAQQINDEVGAIFPEHRIFRIDHYLGKETVQNLLALRFANSLFAPLWQNSLIDHVQITVAEQIGIGSRGSYYDRTGALRDMIQNHLLQLLCLIAMEPPVSFEKESIRDEKMKVLKALVPIEAPEVSAKTVRGQYRPGAIGSHPVCGYLEEKEVDPESTTETFVCLKAEVRNWRWAGVPFYLRTGKRMAERVSEIVLQLRPVPHWMFHPDAGTPLPNLLVIRVQPDEHIRLHMLTKDPGPGGLRLRPAALNLSFAETFKSRFPDAYERLLMDVLRGNPTLFMRRDEVETAWRWTEQILQAWALVGEKPKPYAAGTWGPSAAIALIERDGRTWHDGG